MKPTVLLIDMDEVVADLAAEWFARWNAKHPELEPMTLARNTNWDVGVSAGDRRIYEILSEPGIYQAIKPLPNAIESVKYLHGLRKDGQRVYDINFVTAAVKDPGILSDKAFWMKKHFPFIDSKNIFYAYKKYMVKGDILIDDAPRNIQQYKEAWPNAKTITIDYPHNREVEADFRAMDCFDIANAWEQIKEYLEALRLIS